MKKIKIAQIGTGHDHAHVVFSALNRLTDVFEIVGYAEVPEDDLAYEWTKTNRKNNVYCYQNAQKYTVEELLEKEDLDAVLIETYDLNLVKYAQLFADKGLHIHMDKAAGESAEAFEKLLSIIKEKDLAFNMGYMYRYNPIVREVFKKVRQGDLGRIYSIDAEMSCYYSKEKREWLGGFQSGMMQYLGCHLIDLVVRLQGVPDEIIPYNSSTTADGVNSKDFAFAVLKYPNGVSTIKSSMLESGGYMRRRFIVNGEKGTTEIRPLEYYAEDSSKIKSKITIFTPEDGWTGVGVQTESETFDRYEGMLLAFAEMIQGKRSREVDLETEALVQRCLLTAGGMPCDFKGKITL
jgi:predicted dehydrogenase